MISRPIFTILLVLTLLGCESAGIRSNDYPDVRSVGGIESAEVNDNYNLIMADADWFANAKGSEDLSFFSRWREYRGVAPKGILLMEKKGLRFFKKDGSRTQEHLNIPYEQISLIRTETSYLVVKSISPNSLEPVWHTFYINSEMGSKVGPTDFFTQLEPRIASSTKVEKIGFAVSAWQPAVKFAAQKKMGSDALSRIIEKSAMAGTATAFPCGMCQAVPCGPEMLLPCAALFSIGAVAGGIVATGSELLTGASKSQSEQPNPPIIPQETIQKMSPQINVATKNKFDQAALLKCIMKEVTEDAGSTWIAQGRVAHFSAISEIGSGSPTALESFDKLILQDFRFVSDTFLSEIILVPAGEPGQNIPEVPVHLVINGGVRFINLASRKEKESYITWESEPHSLKEWGADSKMINQVLEQGCVAIAGQAVQASREFWDE